MPGCQGERHVIPTSTVDDDAVLVIATSDEPPVTVVVAVTVLSSRIPVGERRTHLECRSDRAGDVGDGGHGQRCGALLPLASAPVRVQLKEPGNADSRWA